MQRNTMEMLIVCETKHWWKGKLLIEVIDAAGFCAFFSKVYSKVSSLLFTGSFMSDESKVSTWRNEPRFEFFFVETYQGSVYLMCERGVGKSDVIGN